MKKFLLYKSKNRLIALCLCFILALSNVTLYANAEENTTEKEDDKKNDLDIPEEATANAFNGNMASEIIARNKFKQRQGHGFAAEQANNYIDKIKGKNTVVIGDNNVKNGADRLIINRDGSNIFIQDKYCLSGKASIDACFDAEGIFRYVDADGNPMLIEVPSDQYEEAVIRMSEKIESGKIPGINDPNEAKNLVRKGNITYKQAKNIAKAGNIESLVYDARTGSVAAVGTFGISTIINYAVCRMNGQGKEEALKTSAREGVKTGAGVFCTSVIAGQLSRTSVMNIFKPSSEALMRSLGEDFAAKLLKAYGAEVTAAEGEAVALSATKQAARLLRSEVLCAVVTTIVFAVPDAVDVFRGRISKKQFVKNFAVGAVSVVAGVAGYGAGGYVGSLVVSGVGVIPFAIVGAIVLGTGGAAVADKIADYIVDDDADVMYEYMENTFAQLCEDYMVNEEEANNIVSQLDGKLTEDAFKDMYQSKNREQYAKDMLEPLFETEVARREKIEAPTEEEMRAALKEELEGVVFIH